MGALGRIRTCDARFRKPTLYPLSYEGRGASITGRWSAIPDRSSRKADHDHVCAAVAEFTVPFGVAVGTCVDPPHQATTGRRPGLWMNHARSVRGELGPGEARAGDRWAELGRSSLMPSVWCAARSASVQDRRYEALPADPLAAADQ